MHAAVPGTLRSDLDEQVTVIETFDVEVTHNWYLIGLFGEPTEDVLAEPLKDVVRRRGADGVANLLVETQFTPSDLAITTVTLGIVSPRTVHVHGDVVRIDAPPLPGKPVLTGVLAEGAAP